MTTGRINQVTILAGDRRAPHGGAGWFGEGPPLSAPDDRGAPPVIHESAPARSPSAPTEFPRAPSASRRGGERSKPRHAKHGRPRRGTPAAGHAPRRMPTVAYPRKSRGSDGHRPTAHRPHRGRAGTARASAAP